MVVCRECGADASFEVAVEGGEWVPSYWDEASGSEVDGPFCPACVHKLGIFYDAENVDHCRRLAVKEVDHAGN